jgi:hypothetical protein
MVIFITLFHLFLPKAHLTLFLASDQGELFNFFEFMYFCYINKTVKGF